MANVVPKKPPFSINGIKISPGVNETVSLPFGHLSNHAPMNLPVHVVNGRKDGPVLFVSAAIHGDEVIGVEIIRRLLSLPIMNRIRGTLLAVPIVNMYGFISQNRYLPDRRDLNRSFPGSSNGSLASQLADLFVKEIVKRSDFGIDLHSGSNNRTNLPQIRADLSIDRIKDLAQVFGAPVILDSRIRSGSLRDVASDMGIPVLLYEAGEALRFDEAAIRTGLRGILSVMHSIGMLSGRRPKIELDPLVCISSSWLRAPHSGIFRAVSPLGSNVEKGDILGFISNPFGSDEWDIVAHRNGLVIGKTNLPVTNRGDALYHIASYNESEQANDLVDQFVEDVEENIVSNDPPVV